MSRTLSKCHPHINRSAVMHFSNAMLKYSLRNWYLSILLTFHNSATAELLNYRTQWVLVNRYYSSQSHGLQINVWHTDLASYSFTLSRPGTALILMLFTDNFKDVACVPPQYWLFCFSLSSIYPIHAVLTNHNQFLFLSL